MELFLHPWAAALGGALISAPIIIHLINRMRFKRIRWAAMEFLLKSQKRNRRRLLIEQLLLLAMRCLLVMLTGFLVARFLGFSAFGFFQVQNTTHVVVLDDTLSMSDHWREQGEAKNSFEVAKQMIRDVAKSASRAGSVQQLKVIRLSEPETPFFDERINEDSLRVLNTKLDETSCTSMRVEPLRGIEAARELFNQGVQDQRVLHFVSDFRGRDWSGPEADAVDKAVDALAQAGVKVYLLDAAHPNRGETRGVVQYHDNLAIVDLRPETRVAAEGMPVQFAVSVANFSKITRESVRVTVKVEGEERLEASVPIQSLQPGLTRQVFQVVFVKSGFNQITAYLEDENAGVQEDNRRFAVVEVRKQVPVLVIDGDPSVGAKPGGDTFHLQTVFTAAKGYQVVSRGPEELERGNLDQYPCIYLCNVPQLRERALKNLEEYVNNGGGVAFFLGDKVRPDWYRTALYRDGKGLFPAPIADRPTQPPTEAERVEKLFNEQQKVFLRSERYSATTEMPIFGPLTPDNYRGYFQFLLIDRYFPVPRLRWNPEPGKVEELVTLPNERPVTEYAPGAQQLLDALPLKDDKFAKYHPGLEEHVRSVRTALTGNHLYQLAAALRRLLTDTGDPNDPKKPNLTEFWRENDPKVRQLRADVEKLLETVQYGDPLVIAQGFGKGRVVAFLTTAGKGWNDWPGGGGASRTYPVVMLELHKYLTSVGADTNLTVGTPLDVTVDAGRYDNKMHRYHEPDLAQGAAGKADEKAPAGPRGIRDLGEEQGSVTAGRLTFTFKDARDPGIYLLDLYPRPTEQNVEAKPEQRAYVFNVDAANEGDLQRVSREELERTPASGSGKVAFFYPGATPVIDQEPDDPSRWVWFYLLLLLVLVIEQALAVHLSFHLRGGEAGMPTQAAPPAAAAA